MAVLTRDGSVTFFEESIYNEKRDPSRAIMEKLLNLIRRSVESRIRGIGLSLPSKIDEKRGVVFDLMKIPYWKGLGIKRILEDEFNTQVWINNDVNCFILAEKSYGLCKGFKNILCLNIDCNIVTGLTVDGQLLMGNKHLFNHSKCLSIPCYDCIRVYKESYVRTIDELGHMCSQFDKDKSFLAEREMWNELGVLIGRLISILFHNYNFEVVVLGGNLGKSYSKYADSMNTYLEKYIEPQTFIGLVVFASSVEHPKALGAISLINPLAM